MRGNETFCQEYSQNQIFSRKYRILFDIFARQSDGAAETWLRADWGPCPGSRPSVRITPLRQFAATQPGAHSPPPGENSPLS